MRLPNKYGSVRKLSGARRKPYAVVLTTGYKDNGTQIRKYLSYHATKKEALAALAAYHESPFDLGKKDVTFAEVYENWLATRPEGTDKKVRSLFAHCTDLHKMVFRDLRRRHLQATIDKADVGLASKHAIKGLISKMYRYAIDQELATTNFAALVELKTRGKSDMHKPFTDAELAELWEHKAEYAAQVALILCYTGMRPGELLQLDPANIDYDKRIMRGGIKTEAGRNRVIPIAQKLVPILKAFDFSRLPNMTSTLARTLRNSHIEPLTKHKLHDGRHTCATLLDNADINLNVRQLILGHSTGTITDTVYTHKTIDQLIAAIDKI